jgi:alkylated DNA repair protein alkB family protein 4
MNEHLDGPACGVPPPKPTPAAARAKTNVHGHRSHTGGGGSSRGASSSLGASSSSLSRDDATASAASALRFRVEPALPGHFLVPDFVSPEEELELVAELDAIAPPWTPSAFNGAHSGKRWGVECDLTRRVVRPARLEMPASLERLAARMRALGHPALANFRPNEANAISYRREAGHRLDLHVDDRQLSGDVLVNLSLRGDCVMTYEPLRRKPHAKKTGSMNPTTARGVEAPPPRASSVRIGLPRRSLQVQSGSARFDFAHGIRRDDLGDPRRVSVTFRESKTPTSKTRER